MQSYSVGKVPALFIIDLFTSMSPARIVYTVAAGCLPSCLALANINSPRQTKFGDPLLTYGTGRCVLYLLDKHHIPRPSSSGARLHGRTNK